DLVPYVFAGLARFHLRRARNDEARDAFVRARSLGKTDDRQLLDQVAARVQLFQLVGVHVLPGRVEDDVLLAPHQREVPVLGQLPQIPGPQPAVAEHFRRRARIVQVTRHDVGTSREDLADSFHTGLSDADLHY